jgi:hypothetical protein
MNIQNKNKVMKKSVIKTFDKAIVLLLFVFGIFCSCEKPKPMPKYGAPYPDTNVVRPLYGVMQAPFTE